MRHRLGYISGGIVAITRKGKTMRRVFSKIITAKTRSCLESQDYAIAQALRICRQSGHCYVYERGILDFMATTEKHDYLQEIAFYRKGADQD